jgi:hypothetical protein
MSSHDLTERLPDHQSATEIERVKQRLGKLELDVENEIKRGTRPLADPRITELENLVAVLADRLQTVERRAVGDPEQARNLPPHPDVAFELGDKAIGVLQSFTTTPSTAVNLIWIQVNGVLTRTEVPYYVEKLIQIDLIKQVGSGLYSLTTKGRKLLIEQDLLPPAAL